MTSGDSRFDTFALLIRYSELGDSPHDRITCLRLAKRLVDLPSGLYSRYRLQVCPATWDLLMSWIEHAQPNFLRLEGHSIRILQAYKGHILIGTTELIDDLDSTLEAIGEPPPFDAIWQAAVSATMQNAQ